MVKLSDAQFATQHLGPRRMKQMSEVETALAAEIIHKLYGPRYCENCKSVQPVETYKLLGSDYSRTDGMVYTQGFTGTQVCQVCHNTIKDSP